MAKKQTEIAPAKLDLYDKLVSTRPGIERKGVTLPYTSQNGHMFTFLSADGTLAIRLPEKERNEFLKKYKTTLVVAHGTVMKEYAAVPDDLFKKTRELQSWFNISFDYVNSLKPKPSAGKKK